MKLGLQHQQDNRTRECKLSQLTFIPTSGKSTDATLVPLHAGLPWRPHVELMYMPEIDMDDAVVLWRRPSTVHSKTHLSVMSTKGDGVAVSTHRMICCGGSMSRRSSTVGSPTKLPVPHMSCSRYCRGGHTRWPTAHTCGSGLMRSARWCRIC